MLTLLLLRHAKARPQSGDDYARELTAKGHADAKRIGAFLQQYRLVPGRALVSSAVRTRETFEDLAASIQTPIAVEFDDSLYNANAGNLWSRVAETGESVKTLLVTGHNPGILELALKLARDGDRRDLDALRSSFPPASLAIIEFAGPSWADATASGGQLVDFVTPDILDRRG